MMSDESKEVVTKKVERMSFGVIGPNTIKKMATVSVTSPELYDADGYPVERGLMDLGMGVIDPGLRCKTCGGRMRSCLGHFGYIQLAKPVVHVLYASQLYDIMKSFCGKCGRILLSDEKIEQWKEKIAIMGAQGNSEALHDVVKRLTTTLKKTKKCPHCKEKISEMKFEKPSTFHCDDKRLWPTEIRERLEKIPDEDLKILAIDASNVRPEYIVLTMLLVPPITMRPSITLVTGERSEDDLTHKLSDIVRVNQRLNENINAGAPEIIIEDLWDLLQYHVTTFFDNSIAQVPPARHKSNRPLKTIAQRLKGKEGRFRYNLAGKRVNFCARSVISPDPQMSIDEIGIPMQIARELTSPETVTEWNIDWLKEFIKNGDIYPGANYVMTGEGKRKRITEDTKEQIIAELSPGWVVERHLLNGDTVLFNRQPSLHRMSIMGHKVKIVNSRTLRIHPSVTVPYAADFDGDEMNVHLPQTEESKSEAKHLMALQKQVITPRYGLSIIGIVEDALIGLYLLTRGDMHLTREQACDLLLAAGIQTELPAPEKKSDELWNGTQIFSLLLPEDLDCEGANVKIKSGKLVEGKASEKLLSPSGGFLIQEIFTKYGPEKTKDIINALNKVGIKTVKMFPYTFSFSDLDLSKKAKEKISALIDEGEKEVEQVLKQLKEGKVTPLPGKTARETAEAKILYALNKLRGPMGEIVESEAKEEENFLILMAKGGLAGLYNLANMSCSAGQMSLRGKRITRIGYTNRTLSHFAKGDRGARAGGFIKHGYGDGMDPIETFFNCIVGRDSLMDTAMRTPKSGYMQRRLINALQDLKVNYDATVRDAGQKIVQFLFGGDNVDVSKSRGGVVKVD
ncbi:MAG: DNA-directed RNA polymerase subunit A' [archaeon]